MKEAGNMDRVRLRFVALLMALLAIPLFEAAGAQGHVWPDEWESQDVGDVGAAGSSELVGTRLIVRGSGADVWGSVDEFHFAHTSISGDFELTAYVAHVDDVHRWTKAGLMIRDGLGATARHAFLFATPRTERGVAFQRRPVTGGTSVHTSGPATAPPVWLRLTRRGDFVAAAVRAFETDEWTQIGEQSFSGLPHAVNVGFAVSSHVDGYPAEAWFEQITLESLDELPATWNSSDIGDVGAAGTSAYDGHTTWTVTGAGADVWGTSDAFHFSWREVVGNFEFKAWVSSVEHVDVWTKAGLMMRESLAPGARHAFVLATPTAEKGVAFQRRPSTGETSVHTSGPSLAPGVWLRLVRTGDVITAYYSHPTATEDLWIRIGSQMFASLPSTMLVGFAVSSHERGRLAQAVFDESELNLGSPEWQAADIGEVGVAGHSSVDEESGPEFTVTGSGADVWGTADECHFLSREAVGNFDFSARMAFVDGVDKWTKAGLMMRDGLSAHARHAFVIQTPGTERGVAFQRRPVTGGSSLHTAGPATPPPGFLRLVREGDVVRAYHKAEPTDSWMLIGTQTFTSLPATVRIGFAVSSHVDGTLATGYFDNLTLVR
jgi:hypothetical protein